MRAFQGMWHLTWKSAAAAPWKRFINFGVDALVMARQV